MMIVKELLEILSKLPENTIVYIEADHGQQSEQAGHIDVTTDDENRIMPYSGEDLNWDEIEFTELKEITGVRIS